MSGHITRKQQAGSVLQRRKIFKSSPTTRRSHFIWPGGCGQWMDIFPTVRVGYTVIHFPHLSSSFYLLRQTIHPHFKPFSSIPFKLPLLVLLALCFPSSPAALPHRVFSPSNVLIACLCHPLSLSVCGQSHLISLHPSVSLHSFSLLCFRLRLHQALTYYDPLLKSFCGYRLSSKRTTLLTQHNTDSIWTRGMFLKPFRQNDFFFSPH